jgi:hypothetical protein
MSDGLQIIGTVVGLFFLGLVMSNPGFFGLPSYSNYSGGSQAITTNTSQLVVNERAPREIKERSDFPNSATNNDKNGEIVIAQKVRRNSNLTASVSQSAFAGSVTTTNYPVLLLIIIMLVIAVILARITMRKRGQMDQRRYGYQAPVQPKQPYRHPQMGYAPQYAYQQHR